MFGAVLVNVEGITLGIDVGTELGSLYGYFHGYNDGKLGGILLRGSLLSTVGKPRVYSW